MPNQETLKSKATEVFNLLLATYGTPRWEPGEDPVDVLIGTILSANTNDVNSGRAFEQLKVAFNGNWDAVRMAPLASVIDAIRPAGMYHQKAPAIVATLEKIKVDRGVYNLDFLAEIPVDEALNYLSSFQGVGFKTASIVLLFCFNRAAFPVDTHIQRISKNMTTLKKGDKAPNFSGTDQDGKTHQLADYKGKILDNALTGLQMLVNDIEVHFRLIGEFKL